LGISKFSVEDLVLKKVKESSKDLISCKMSRTSMNKTDEYNMNWNVMSLNIYERNKPESIDKVDKRVMKKVFLKPIKNEKKKSKERESVLIEKKEKKIYQNLKESYITYNSPRIFENIKKSPFPRVLFIKTINKNVKK